jgi:hypothetical protein
MSKIKCGPGNSLGIATDYGLDGPGIESRWGRVIPPVETGPGAHTASCTMGTGSFLGVKYGRGMLLTPRPLLVPMSWKSRAVPQPTLWATTGTCNGVTLPLPLSEKSSVTNYVVIVAIRLTHCHYKVN